MTDKELASLGFLYSDTIEFMIQQELSTNIPPTVTFYGATQTVTGSMHLVEMAGWKVLLDCGLYLGSNPEARRYNRAFPFDPRTLDAVVISHAHIDHCGNLPNLVRQGYCGPIYATPPSCDLMGVMLRDSAKIQQDQSTAPIPPPNWNQTIYTARDVEQTISQCVGIPYGHVQPIGSAMEFRLVDAGHILGSAMISLKMDWQGREYHVTYTGDMGRQGIPFLKAPDPVPPADLLICESTYGGKMHDSLDNLAQNMATIIEKTISRGGKVLIPAFSLGRAQVVVHYLQKWILDRHIPNLPIFVDSPLVADIVEVYRRHPLCLTEDNQVLVQEEDAQAKGLKLMYLRSWEESKEVTARNEPCIIVASGGMLDAGRALYHLQQYIDDPRCTIVLVSYQAPQSLGARLLERGPRVFFMGKYWNKWADVVHMNGFSGHADQKDFLQALTPLVGSTHKVKLVHGELAQAEALAHSLRETGFGRVDIPEREQRARIG